MSNGNLLACAMENMVLSSSWYADSLRGVFRSLLKNALKDASLCVRGEAESKGMTFLVVVGFLYMLRCIDLLNLVSFKSRKGKELLDSISRVNFMLGCMLLR